MNPYLTVFLAAGLLAVDATAQQPSPCLGPQYFFGSDWQDSSYTAGGHTPQWFTDTTPNWDVACIEDQAGVPAIWSNDCFVGCRRYEFWMKARGRSDDNSAMGFVFGFCDGDQNNPNADYFAVLWFGDSETMNLPGCHGSATHPRGLYLVRVTGIPDPAEMWSMQDLPCNGPNNAVELLATATNLGDTAYTRYAPTNVVFEMEIDNLKVWINGSLEFDRDGDYSDYRRGCFGYYSQGLFADFWMLETEPTNPTTASWNNYGTGVAGCYGVPSLTMLNRPVIGSVPQIEFGNAGPSPKSAAVFWSTASDNVFIPFLGGNLLIEAPYPAVTSHLLPPGGLVFECNVVDTSCQGGREFFLQLVCPDDCAPAGFALSQGLRIVIGDY